MRTCSLDQQAGVRRRRQVPHLFPIHIRKGLVSACRVAVADEEILHIFCVHPVRQDLKALADTAPACLLGAVSSLLGHPYSDVGDSPGRMWCKYGKGETCGMYVLPGEACEGVVRHAWCCMFVAERAQRTQNKTQAVHWTQWNTC